MSTPTVYLDFTADQMWEFSRRGLCVNCGLGHVGDCFARYCDSCSQFWLADTGQDGDDGRPFPEPCPECLRCEYCGDEMDEENAGEPCLDCANQLKREEAEKEYWKEVNRTAYVTSQYNDGSG